MPAKSDASVSCQSTSAFARRANQRFHVIEVALERATTGGRDRVFRFRHATLEGLLAQHVLRFLELAGVDAEIAVRRPQQRFQIAEAHPLVDGERAENAETHTLVNEPVEG